MSVDNNPAARAAANTLYNSLTKQENNSGAKVKVGTFRGARVTVTLSKGGVEKMSFDEFKKRVENATKHLSKDEGASLTKVLERVTADANQNSKGRALINKVKGAFKLFKEKITNTAGRVAENIKDAKDNASFAIRHAPDKIRDAKHESDVEKHLYHFAVNTAIKDLNQKDPPKTSLNMLADQLLFNPEVKISDLKKLQVILKKNHDPDFAFKKALIDRKINLMNGEASVRNKGGKARLDFRTQYEKTRLGSANAAAVSLNNMMPVDKNTLERVRDEIKLFLSVYTSDEKYVGMLDRINAEIEKLDSASTSAPPKPLPQTPQTTSPPPNTADSAQLDQAQKQERITQFQNKITEFNELITTCERLILKNELLKIKILGENPENNSDLIAGCESNIQELKGFIAKYKDYIVKAQAEIAKMNEQI